jgi:ATP-dependent DNA ligase
MTLQLPNVKPMLAGKLDYAKLAGRYPIAVQPKVDGIRALIHGGRAFSRTLKLIPNREIQAWCKAYQEELEGFDGELIVGDPFAKDAFQVTTSGVMSEHGVPNFRLHVFDMWNLPDLGFADRYMRLSVRLLNLTQSNVSIILVRVPTKTVRDNVELASEISNVLAQGWEGDRKNHPRGWF